MAVQGGPACSGSSDWGHWAAACTLHLPPVVVWFHGGGLASGLAGMYEPSFLMDYQVSREANIIHKTVVVCTMHIQTFYM